MCLEFIRKERLETMNICQVRVSLRVLFLQFELLAKLESVLRRHVILGFLEDSLQRHILVLLCLDLCIFYTRDPVR